VVRMMTGAATKVIIRATTKAMTANAIKSYTIIATS
jgi:hypothetical protein